MPLLSFAEKFDKHLFDGEQMNRKRGSEYGEGSSPLDAPTAQRANEPNSPLQ
jgi:hypothetical protein